MDASSDMGPRLPGKDATALGGLGAGFQPALAIAPQGDYVDLMEYEPGIFDARDAEHEAELIASARAEAMSGKGFGHDVVGPWLLTWGNPDFKPFGEWLAARNG